MARLAARLPVLYRPNARNLQDDARAGRLGITKPKARKHWLEPCARRNATEANRPAARLLGARDARRMPSSSHFAISGNTCASQEHFFVERPLVPSSSRLLISADRDHFICAHPVGPPPP